MRWGWALTGSGHFFTESLDLIRSLDAVDLFVSRAAAEVVRMYRTKLDLPSGTHIYRDTAASAPPVGRFYEGVYHTLVVAPATSNTVAKCVVGISDTLATNVFAQAGKCRVPASWDVSSDSLALWLAARLAVPALLLVKSRSDGDDLLDAAFAGLRPGYAGHVYVAGPEHLPRDGIDPLHPPGVMLP